MRIYMLILLSLVFLYGQNGCTDITACNYDPDAIEDNGSCLSNAGIFFDCDDATTGCDCNNDCGGGAQMDDCEICSAGNTGHAVNSDQDCSGECGGTKVVDECNVCDGPGLGTGIYFTDCWDGNEYCYSDLSTCDNQSEAVNCNSLDLDYCPFNPDGCEDGTTGCDCNDDCAGNDGCYGSLFNDICVPTVFSSVNQSSQQAFYRILSVTINGEPIDADDWVGAFNGNVCVGAMKGCSVGSVCYFIVLGSDDSIFPDETEGYMQTGNIPTFQIYDALDNMYYFAYVSEEIAWEAGGGSDSDDLERWTISSLTTDPLSIYDGASPDTYSIYNIYPNPFNPITSIEYSLPENADIELSIYNIHGRHIQTLVQSFQTAGYYSINWNAQNYPSGVYLIRLGSLTYSQTQKVVLIK